MIETVAETAMRLKHRAHAGPIGKRQSSFQLYGLLADCMELAQRDGALDEMKRLVRDAPSSGKGRWTYATTDAYLAVCRFVFPRSGDGRGELSNASRYAICLRRAAERQISPKALAEWLGSNGGINALYATRPVERATARTKTLYLSEQIEVEKETAFTLVLRRRADNVYEVVKGPEYEIA